ncbi:MAG: HAD-IA family hydrolase [Candidatus Omnitrophota bacterium]|nr:HAD-IA family hydrolase [Candidatus Omnitrophota bacterium]
MEEKRSPYLKHITVCTHEREAGKSCCAHRDGEKILEKLKAYVQEHGLKGKARVNRSGCMDLCEQGANVMVAPDHRWYSGVTVESAEQIIEEHLKPLVPGTGGSGAAAPGTIKAFLFDLGNVLVRFDHMAAARKITQGTGAAPEKLFEMFFESPLVVEHDTGRISTRQFYEEVSRQIGMRLPYERFLEVWNDIFVVDEAMNRLVERLLQEFPCYLISNTNRPHFEYLRTLCPVLERLNGWILSYEVGHLKPNPVIYHRALEIARLKPSEIFYVDDRDDLIQAAHSMGFQTHRFGGFEGLAADLAARGLPNGQ